jgi:hypothetical protein
MVGADLQGHLGGYCNYSETIHALRVAVAISSAAGLSLLGQAGTFSAFKAPLGAQYMASGIA